MEQMKFLLDDQLNQGALGLSLGLIYPPGSFSPTSELRELARVVQKHKKILAVHMRNEGPNIFQAVEEMLSIAEETGVHLHISHLKLMGKAQWGQAPRLLERIEASRQRGAVVTCDQYPYTATSTILAALLPRRAYDGGSAAMLRRVSDPDTSLLRDIAEEMGRRGGADAVLVASTHGSAPEYHGKPSPSSLFAWDLPQPKLLPIFWRVVPELCLPSIFPCPKRTSIPSYATCMSPLAVMAPPSLFRIHRACPALTLATLQPFPVFCRPCGSTD